jgi:hypothetical protein
MTKSLNDAERALERAAGATEAGHEAYFDNVDVPFVPRATVGRDRSRFPGLLAYFALAHPGGELAGHKVIFVESDGKLVVRLRTTTLPKVADLVESMDEARQKGHSVTTPRLLGSTAGMEGSAGPRRPSRPAPTRRPLPFAKPEEKPK